MKLMAKKILCLLALIAIILPETLISVQAEKYTALEGEIEIESSRTGGSGSFSDSASANGYEISVTSAFLSNTTATIKLWNRSGNDATISFDYVSSTSNSTFTLDGEDKTGSGSYSKMISANACVTMTLQAKYNWGNKTAKLSLSNLNLVVAEASNDVTVLFDDSLGGVTVDGVAVSNEFIKSDVALGESVSLVATPSSGVTFLAWINSSNGSIYSTESNYTLTPANDVTVKAVFVPNTGARAWFCVGGTYLFDDLNVADEFALTASDRTIMLMNSGTLPSGTNYTISAGNKFIVPYTANDDGNFKVAADTLPQNTAATGAFRTLTIPDGVELIVEGDMSVNSALGAPGSGDTGHPTGKYGHVVLNGTNAKITVKGSLTCYGFISGKGMVHAVSGASVYETFQLRDWRGGQSTYDWYDWGRRPLNSFVVNEYYVQNIETKYRVDQGAKSNVCASMSMSLIVARLLLAAAF